MKIFTKKNIKTEGTVKVTFKNGSTSLRAIYLPTLEVQEVNVVGLYRASTSEHPLTNSEQFKKMFLEMFPGSAEVLYSPSALNIVIGLAHLNSQKIRTY